VQKIVEDISGNENQWPGDITVENGKVYVVYVYRDIPVDAEIFYRYFDGITWQPALEISTDKGMEYQQSPDIAVENGIAHVVWQEGVWGGENDIYYRRFVPPIIDLQITNDDIVFNPDSPVVNGTYVNINATIHNVGTLMVNDINVSFYNGDPALGGTLIGVNQTIPFLMIGGNVPVNITWFPPSPGTYEIYVAVDYPPPGIILENDETNNIASKILEVTALLPPTLFIEADGDDIILNWTPLRIPGVSNYLIYRSSSQTGYNFSDIWNDTLIHDDNGIIPLRTTWNDTGAALDTAPQEYYYTIRTVLVSGEISSTSRTVGKWTKTFSQGISTFSLPFEPLQPITANYLLNDMNATYIKWMNTTTHTWMKHGDGGNNDTEIIVGVGYEVKFDSITDYTFTGLPGAMISYDDDSGFIGFSYATEAKNLTVNVEPNGDVNLTWWEPPIMAPGDHYKIYYSNTRDGFFGDLNFDYFQACPPVDFGTNATTHVGAQANDPGARLYYIVVPFDSMGNQGASTYSIGIWTEEYLPGYDTFGIPLKMNVNHAADWYCDNIPDAVGINYFIFSLQEWGWHSTRMPKGAFDPILEMAEGYQISTSNAAKFTFIGV
jgi:hypothetical protein